MRARIRNTHTLTPTLRNDRTSEYFHSHRNRAQHSCMRVSAYFYACLAVYLLHSIELYTDSILSIFVHFQQSRRKLNSMFATTKSLINRSVIAAHFYWLAYLVLFAALFFKTAYQFSWIRRVHNIPSLPSIYIHAQHKWQHFFPLQKRRSPLTSHNRAVCLRSRRSWNRPATTMTLMTESNIKYTHEKNYLNGNCRLQIIRATFTFVFSSLSIQFFRFRLFRVLVLKMKLMSDTNL